jgi:predicted N-acyltransferase
MQKIVEIQNIDRSAWDELIETSSVATWFQSNEAFRFFDSLSFVEAFAYGVENEVGLKGVVIGYVQKDGGTIKKFLSKRAIITGGPLLANDITEEELGALLNTLKFRLKRKTIYIETRNFNDYSRWSKTFEECGFDYEPHYDIWVDTSNMDVVNEHLGKSRKRDIRVSLRDGATLVTQPTIEQVRDYYSILSDLYKNKVKTPLFPFAFFEKLYQLPSSAFLLVEYNGEIVGGTVCVALRGKTLYEMYACGKDGVHKNIFPSELATFGGLQYAVEHGLPRFDMMGAGRPDDGGYGVRDFKLKFGGELVEFGRNICVCNRLLYGIGKLGIKVLKKL